VRERDRVDGDCLPPKLPQPRKWLHAFDKRCAQHHSMQNVCAEAVYISGEGCLRVGGEGGGGSAMQAVRLALGMGHRRRPATTYKETPCGSHTNSSVQSECVWCVVIACRRSTSAVITNSDLDVLLL